MSDYEVEIGTVTEHSDARTGEPFAVDVEVHVQQASGPTSPSSGTYEIRFDVEDGAAMLSEFDGRPNAPLALVAIRAAAHELAAITDAYAVHDPIEAAADADYETMSGATSPEA